MMHYLVVAPRSMPDSTVGTSQTLASSRVEIERSLDAAEAGLAALAASAHLTELQELELHEIRLLVSAVAAQLLGARHPLVAGLAGARSRSETSESK